MVPGEVYNVVTSRFSKPDSPDIPEKYPSEEKPMKLYSPPPRVERGSPVEEGERNVLWRFQTPESPSFYNRVNIRVVANYGDDEVAVFQQEVCLVYFILF